jgi:predicted acetyltransferase
LAGFALIYDIPEIKDEETDYIIIDFFVMYKYRRLGIGRKAVFEIFDRHRGKWYTYYNPKNTASVYFWGKVIDEYTDGRYKLVKSHPQCIYSDGTLGDAVFFDNANPR